MAALTITAANVLKSNGGQGGSGKAGQAITAGQVVYTDPADGLLKLADSDASADARTITGIALNGAAVNQPVQYVSIDSAFVVGATLSPGLPLYVSPTPGGITQDIDDLAIEGSNSVIIGVAINASTAQIGEPFYGGIVEA